MIRLADIVSAISLIDNVTVFSRAASRVRRQFPLFEILSVACLVPESRPAPGESHRGINRLSSAKAEIGFDFHIGKLRVSHWPVTAKSRIWRENGANLARPDAFAPYEIPINTGKISAFLTKLKQMAAPLPNLWPFSNSVSVRPSQTPLEHKLVIA